MLSIHHPKKTSSSSSSSWRIAIWTMSSRASGNVNGGWDRKDVVSALSEWMPDEKKYCVMDFEQAQSAKNQFLKNIDEERLLDTILIGKEINSTYSKGVFMNINTGKLIFRSSTHAKNLQCSKRTRKVPIDTQYKVKVGVFNSDVKKKKKKKKIIVN